LGGGASGIGAITDFLFLLPAGRPAFFLGVAIGRSVRVGGGSTISGTKTVSMLSAIYMPVYFK
jgi:hypothetical protein